MKTSLLFVFSACSALAVSVSGADKPKLGIVVQDAVARNWWHAAGAEAALDVFSRVPDNEARFQVIDLGKFDARLREVREALRG